MTEKNVTRHQKACKAVYYGVKVGKALLGFLIFVGFSTLIGWVGYDFDEPFFFIQKVENPTLWTYTYQGIFELAIVLLSLAIVVAIIYGIVSGIYKAYEMYQEGEALAKKGTR